VTEDLAGRMTQEFYLTFLLELADYEFTFAEELA